MVASARRSFLRTAREGARDEHIARPHAGFFHASAAWHGAAFAALERFLTSQGRRKFVRPLYAELAKSDWGREMAMRIYRRTRPNYHSVTSTSVDQILNWPAAQPSPAAR